MSKQTTCFNCGDRSHKHVLFYNGYTAWRCEDQRGCKKRLGPCAQCGRETDNHSVEWGSRGEPLGPIDHEFKRNAVAQAAVDEAYP